MSTNEKLWCAACGTWGDHRSGGCPTISFQTPGIEIIRFNPTLQKWVLSPALKEIIKALVIETIAEQVNKGNGTLELIAREAKESS